MLLSFTTLWIYTTPKLKTYKERRERVLLPYEFTLLQNSARIIITAVNVLLPYEFTLLQNLKRGLKLLPVHVSQGFSNAFYYITSLLSEKHIECHACANLFNYPAILHLFKCSNRHLKLLPAQKSRKYTTPKLWDGYWRITSVLLPYEFTLLQNTIKDYLTLLFVLLPYEFTLLQNELINAIDLMVVLLPCKFTLLQNLKRRLKLLPVHVSQDIQLHLIISPPFCQKHIDYHIYARLFNYPAILHLFRP